MYAAPVQDLIDELGRLPGIGPKSAQRIAFYILKSPAEDAARLAASINAAKSRVTWCRRCFNVAEGDGSSECEMCSDTREIPRSCVWSRSPATSWRSKRPGSSGAVTTCCRERSARSMASAPNNCAFASCSRIEAEGVKEVILCTNPNIEGDATALYLASLLKHFPMKVTRIASGLPVGGDLEYADELTLGRALEGRREFG